MGGENISLTGEQAGGGRICGNQIPAPQPSQVPSLRTQTEPKETLGQGRLPKEEGFGALNGGGGFGSASLPRVKCESITDVPHFPWKGKEKCFCREEIGGAGVAEQ